LKTKELRALGDAELKKKLDEAYKEYFTLRFQAATRQLKNHREPPRARKDIALLKTIIRERELGIR